MNIRFLLAAALLSVLAGGGVDAENTCVICPDGASVGDDTAPHADEGDPITCRELIEAARLFETGSEWCALYEVEEFFCCPAVSPPRDPCTVCPDGVTVGDDVAPFDYGEGPVTCSVMAAILNSGLVSLESESDGCTWSGRVFEAVCCPTVAKDPCVICPDGSSVGDDIVPYADRGILLTCKELIESDATYEAGSKECSSVEDIDAAYCCPTVPKNPCNICPGGATAGDDFVPYWGNSYNCMELIAEAKLLEHGSGSCKFYEGYEISCCPSAATDTTAAPAEDTGTSATNAAIPEIGDETANATDAAPVEETSTSTSPGRMPFLGGGFALISFVSVICLLVFV